MQDGVMQTHDEETKKYFKHSSVHCVLAPRYASNKLSIFKQQVWNTYMWISSFTVIRCYFPLMYCSDSSFYFHN